MSRKFFGNPNGSHPAPQQAKLSFSAPASSDRETPAKPSPDVALCKDEDEIKAVKAEDGSEDIIMNGATEHTEETKNIEENGILSEEPASSPPRSHKSPKRSQKEMKEEDEEDDDEPVLKRSRKSSKPEVSKGSGKSSVNGKAMTDRINDTKPGKQRTTPSEPAPKISNNTKVNPAAVSVQKDDGGNADDDAALEDEQTASETEEEEKPEVAAKARAKVQSTLKSNDNDPYPDWKPGEPVPYAALCTTLSLIELTSKRLEMSALCSRFLRQVLRLTPDDLLPTVRLMIGKIAPDFEGIELGIGESFIRKAIGESTGRNLDVVMKDQNRIGDLGLVAIHSRSSQKTMFKPHALTVRGVLAGLLKIATENGKESQNRKVSGITKLLTAADIDTAGRGNLSVDINKNKGGPSEAKFIVRFLEGKLRTGLAEKTATVALAHAMVTHELEKHGKKVPSAEKLAEGESVLKTVYRYGSIVIKMLSSNFLSVSFQTTTR